MYGGLLRVFSFTHSMRGSGYVYGIYPRTYSYGRQLVFRWPSTLKRSDLSHGSVVLESDSPKSKYS